jgi:hypothetical protein
MSSAKKLAMRLGSGIFYLLYSAHIKALPKTKQREFG